MTPAALEPSRLFFDLLSQRLQRTHQVVRLPKPLRPCASEAPLKTRAHAAPGEHSYAEQGNYHELGSLSELREALKDLPLEGAPHIRLSDIERKDWFTVINPEGARMIGHYSLIDIYGIEFLTLLFANGTIG